MLDADLSAIFADTLFTVSVVFGPQTTRGFYDVLVGDRSTDPYAASSRAGRTETVRIQAKALTGLALEKDITVAGKQYRIIDVLEEDDGRVLRLDLHRAA